ncbi:MAG: lipopolysaccharide transport periplasmic protein LptA [Wenzhouxiangellaceae bacterium]|nr:lipopolysaccharide transport periplasmic protein LptA [Wenzhouxiangellaceae bacterium]
MYTRFIARLTLLPILLLVSLSISAQQPADQTSSDPAVEPPIIIDSETNEYDLRSGVTRFSKNVEIQRGDMRVNADQGIIRQANGRITVVELEGSPTIWRDRLEDGSQVEGEAKNIHFNVIDNIVTLTGNARIRHEQGEFTGDELVYDLDSESLAGRSAGDGRVRVVIEPEAMNRNQNRNDNGAPGSEPEDPPPSRPETEGERAVPPEEGNEIESDTESDTETDSQPVPQARSQPESLSGGKTGSEAMPEDQSTFEPEDASATDSELASGPGTEADATSEAASETKPEAEDDSESEADVEPPKQSSGTRVAEQADLG